MTESRRRAFGFGLGACLLLSAAVGCSSDDGATDPDLPKADTIWIRVSTDGVAPIITAHATQADAETGDRPAGVASSPVDDSDPSLYFFRNVDAFEPDVTGWLIRLESNPAISGICEQTEPAADVTMTLCSELEPIANP
ncbi:MAG: hypothetical protein R3E97_03280 [Candidatus Eisenbacteria bacterium]